MNTFQLVEKRRTTKEKIEEPALVKMEQAWMSYNDDDVDTFYHLYLFVLFSV